jgi:hypothetical protein
MKVTTQRVGAEVLEEMVQLVRSTYSETLTAGDGRGLARLEEAFHQKGASRRGGGLRVLVAAMAAVVLAAGGLAVYRHFDRLTYEVMNGAIGPGGFVRPTAAGTTILFSEGSEVVLGEAARTRVDGTTADGGRLVVEGGSVQARIVPRKHARWFVDAGPYTIRVTGTVFNVKWSWTDELLDLRMDRGSVIVTGPLAPGGVTLTAGMRLTANPRSGLAIGRGGVAAPARVTSRAVSGGGSRSGLGSAATTPMTDDLSDTPSDEEALAPESASSPSADLPSQIDPPAVFDDRFHGGGRPRGPAQIRHHGTDRRPSRSLSGSAGAGRVSESSTAAGAAWAAWDRMLARGDVQGILDEAQARGTDRVLTNVSERDLSALADAARYGHRPSLARMALLSMRERFPRSAEARDAAFFLGGLAEDAAGPGGSGQASALDWYERYLGESARGRYAAQALGRKMVMTQKLNGTEAAASVADEYLSRFPQGPYAAAARKLLRAR